MTETTTPLSAAAQKVRQTAMLERVRKLLAKAEAEGVTPQEAESLTAKAAELMARYGIDAAMAAAKEHKHVKPSNRVIDIANPWAQVRAHLLAGLAGAMGCQCVLLHTSGPGARVHVFGYEDDLAQVDMLYTSLLLQMTSAHAHVRVPDGVRSVRAWNRSWLLGWVSVVIYRARDAYGRAKEAAKADTPGTELVLADRSDAVRDALTSTYSNLRSTRITYSGRGYSQGHAAGQRANIHDRSGVGSGSREIRS